MIEILDKKDCCGCTACDAVCGVKAIEMKADDEGFLYPEVNRSRCVDCSLCEKVCPIIFRDSTPATNMPLSVYALHNKDKEIWEASSSGGVFATLANYCIKQGGIVYGAEYDNDFTVVHQGETTVDGALKFRGSKYVQSDLRNVFREIRSYLLKGKMVLFSGVPCQVEGLKCFLRKPYTNLLTVDILCHGVPSPKVFADYIAFIRKYSTSMLTGINMKDKTFGWGYQNLRLFFGKKHSQFNTPLSNLWNKIYYGHVANRPSCHACRFTNYHRSGDLTIGDYWGIEKTHPEFMNTNGISLLMVNTVLGTKIWNEINISFKYLECNLNTCTQPALYKPQTSSPDRKAFWYEYQEYSFEKTILHRDYVTQRSLFFNKIVQYLTRLKV